MQKKVVIMPAIYYFPPILLNCKEVSHDNNKYEYSLRTISEVISSLLFAVRQSIYFLSFTLYGLVYGQVCSLFI